MVEYHLAMVGVESSSLFCRSNFRITTHRLVGFLSQSNYL